MVTMVWVDPGTDIREATSTGVVRIPQYLGLEFDAVISEEHASSAEATEHPVEEGIAITDHVKPNPARLSLQAVVTNTPLNQVLTTIKDPNGAYASGVAPLLLLNHPEVIQIDTKRQMQPGRVILPQVSPFKFPGIKRASTPAQAFPGVWVEDARFLATRINGSHPWRQNRVRAVYEALVDIVDTGTPVRLVTELRTYESLLLVSVTAPVKPEDAIVFALEFKEFRTASTRNARVTKTEKKPAEKRAEPKKDEGPKGPGYLFAKPPDLRSVSHRIGLSGGS
jgi:hypothetical protein